MKYEISISEPWFTHIANGDKTIEGRLKKGVFQNLQEGDIVLWYIKEKKYTHNVLTQIIDIKEYKTFEDMLRKSTLKKTLPGIRTYKDGVAVYRQYYTKQKEKEHGILAIELKRI